jgi:hypothetical protein
MSIGGPGAYGPCEVGHTPPDAIDCVMPHQQHRSIAFPPETCVS